MSYNEEVRHKELMKILERIASELEESNVLRTHIVDGLDEIRVELDEIGTAIERIG